MRRRRAITTIAPRRARPLAAARPRALAAAAGERDAADHRDHEQHRGDLERPDEVGEQALRERLDVAGARGVERRRASSARPWPSGGRRARRPARTAARRATIATGRWNGLGSSKRLVLVDAEQRDHEHEQHDDRARVHDDLDRGDERGVAAAGTAPRRSRASAAGTAPSAPGCARAMTPSAPTMTPTAQTKKMTASISVRTGSSVRRSSDPCSGRARRRSRARPTSRRGLRTRPTPHGDVARIHALVWSSSPPVHSSHGMPLGPAVVVDEELVLRVDRVGAVGERELEELASR